MNEFKSMETREWFSVYVVFWESQKRKCEKFFLCFIALKLGLLLALSWLFITSLSRVLVRPYDITFFKSALFRSVLFYRFASVHTAKLKKSLSFFHSLTAIERVTSFLISLAKVFKSFWWLDFDHTWLTHSIKWLLHLKT